MAGALVGCRQPALQGTWELRGPGQHKSVIVFFEDGTYSHDVMNGEVFARGRYRTPGGRLVLNQTSWFSPKPENHKGILAVPVAETEVDISWRSPDEAVLSSGGVTKVLKRRA